MIAIAVEHRSQLPVHRMSRLFGFSRAAFYRSLRAADDADQTLTDAIHAIVLDWPGYGYRTVTQELRRGGWIVNEKRVRRIMRRDGLLAYRRKRRGLAYRAHGLETFPNLARGFTPSGIDQLWVSDFTYVRLFGAFIFVAIVLDAFSRRVVGWSVARHYRTELTLEALRMALHRRRPGPGLMHHSDRGSQYAAEEYVHLLKRSGTVISMSRPGTPSDNPICERFMRTLKYEEVLIREYADFHDAVHQIGRFIEVTYNLKRLHSALGYRPPAEFERLHAEPEFIPTPA
jgi:transposase InsO family protein